MSSLNNFGNILRNLRAEKNVSTYDIEKSTNIKHQNISRWENGQAEPSNLALITLASYFNVTVDYLLGLENEDFTKTYDYSIEKIKSDLAGDSNASAKLDMKNKIENIAKDKKIPLEKLSNLSEEQINLIIQLAKTFNKN